MTIHSLAKEVPPRWPLTLKGACERPLSAGSALGLQRPRPGHFSQGTVFSPMCLPVERMAESLFFWLQTAPSPPRRTSPRSAGTASATSVRPAPLFPACRSFGRRRFRTRCFCVFVSHLATHWSYNEISASYHFTCPSRVGVSVAFMVGPGLRHRCSGVAFRVPLALGMPQGRPRLTRTLLLG